MSLDLDISYSFPKESMSTSCYSFYYNIPNFQYLNTIAKNTFL